MPPIRARPVLSKAAAYLSEEKPEGLEVQDVSAYTGFPEMMDGRLKTLHPKVFGGILCRHDRDDDMQAIAEHGIEVFDLIVVNLYPFESTIARDGVTIAEAIEQIDIGGPSLVRTSRGTAERWSDGGTCRRGWHG